MQSLCVVGGTTVSATSPTTKQYTGGLPCRIGRKNVRRCRKRRVGPNGWFGAWIFPDVQCHHPTSCPYERCLEPPFCVSEYRLQSWSVGWLAGWLASVSRSYCQSPRMNKAALMAPTISTGRDCVVVVVVAVSVGKGLCVSSPHRHTHTQREGLNKGTRNDRTIVPMRTATRILQPERNAERGRTELWQQRSEGDEDDNGDKVDGDGSTAVESFRGFVPLGAFFH